MSETLNYFSSARTKARALFNCTADQEDELSFEKGQVFVEVRTYPENDGWYLATMWVKATEKVLTDNFQGIERTANEWPGAGTFHWVSWLTQNHLFASLPRWKHVFTFGLLLLPQFKTTTCTSCTLRVLQTVSNSVVPGPLQPLHFFPLWNAWKSTLCSVKFTPPSK